MKKLTLKEFEKMTNFERIEELMKLNNGYILSKDVTALGIHRMYIKIMEERKLIVKVGTGVYIKKGKETDPFFVFSCITPNATLSHRTALYLHGYIDLKDKYDVTVIKAYHNKKIDKYNTFYVNKKIYNLGRIKLKDKYGNKIETYDLERCICDMIRSRKRIDINEIKYVIKKYINSKNKDLNKIGIYAKKMNIKDEVMFFLTMMQ